MNRIMHVFAVAVTGFLFSCAPAPKAVDTAALIASAEKLDKAFLEAFNKGDAEALAALYWNSPDVVSFPPDAMIARGLEAIKQANVATFATMKGAKLELTESHHQVSGDTVLSWGLFKVTAPGPDGKPMEMAGRFTDVKAERDGKWVYLMDHASAPMPPPPPPKK